MKKLKKAITKLWFDALSEDVKVKYIIDHGDRVKSDFDVAISVKSKHDTLRGEKPEFERFRYTGGEHSLYVIQLKTVDWRVVAGKKYIFITPLTVTGVSGGETHRIEQNFFADHLDPTNEELDLLMFSEPGFCSAILEAYTPIQKSLCAAYMSVKWGESWYRKEKRGC